jgi:ABC-type bacteriocin/lantibiotic exporter with double-glycine peptidase domain
MITIKKVTQQTDCWCGPAVLAMLLDFLGKKVTQDEIVEAARIKTWIEYHGTQPHHMAKALRKLAPEMQLWIKNNATVKDITTLISVHTWPVGVNWQGLFYKTAKEEASYPPEESGHYSILVDLSAKKNQVTLVDPYPGFSTQPRIFSLTWFKKRWWDSIDTKNPDSGRIAKLSTHKSIFLIAPKNVTFPKKLGMTVLEK